MKLTLEFMRDHSDGIERRAELMCGRRGESTQSNRLLFSSKIEARFRQLLTSGGALPMPPTTHKHQ